MSNHDPHKKILKLIDQAFVPKGHRPSTSADIDNMFEALRGDDIEEDKLARMLRKINGEEELFVGDATIASTSDEIESSQQLTAEEEQLLALYRGKGEDVPPDIAEKLKELEDRASKPPAEDEEEGA